MYSYFVLPLLLSVAAQVPAGHPVLPAAPQPHPSVVAVYVPQRVYDTRRNTFSDFEGMLADLARADVAIVGEQHDDPNTHRLQAAMLQGLLRRSVTVTVSLEMFERDVQKWLDAYLAGTIGEEEFLEHSRPWPRYATDYRPLVEFARAHGWNVIASNVPRKYAGDVAKRGLGALDGLPPDERAFVARDLECPLDDYFDRFAESMNAHPAPGSDKTSEDIRRETIERYYYSQCVKDETMAEAIAGAYAGQQGRPGTILHFNGAFHSDFAAGVVERVRRRLQGRRVALVTILPVEDMDRIAPDAEELKRAEYLVYTAR